LYVYVIVSLCHIAPHFHINLRSIRTIEKQHEGIVIHSLVIRRERAVFQLPATREKRDFSQYFNNKGSGLSYLLFLMNDKIKV